MERRDNYAIQAENARGLFLGYDQQALIRKLGLREDADWIYVRFFHSDYRIGRLTGSMERFHEGVWQDGNSFPEVMTILDLVCDSREDRHLAHRWKNMTDFGLQFHRSLMEEGADPFADAIQANPRRFSSACEALGGTPLTGADMAFSIPVFGELAIALFFWEGDEEFAPRVRFLWDENALMYIKYETMYYAVGFLKEQLLREMEQSGGNHHA